MDARSRLRSGRLGGIELGTPRVVSWVVDRRGGAPAAGPAPTRGPLTGLLQNPGGGRRRQRVAAVAAIVLLVAVLVATVMNLAGDLWRVLAQLALLVTAALAVWFALT